MLKHFPTFTFITLSSLPAIQAEPLVAYHFTQSEVPSVVSPSVTASPLTGNGGLINAQWSKLGDSSGYYASGASRAATAVGSWGDTNEMLFGQDLNYAITKQNYLSFTLEAAVPGTLNLSHFSISTSRAGQKSACHFTILAQANGGTQWTPASAITSDQHTTVLQTDKAWQPTGVNLAQNPAYQGIDSVEFRIYFWGGSGHPAGTRISVDNLLVEGSAETASGFAVLNLNGSTLVLTPSQSSKHSNKK
ncbi:hypothetical protein ACFPK9_07440 [Rubritalea spongiae]|uniref:Uncharacterized protein n=1 Tax=Rubritalea spongiae TaxID=430797 RepID=A0ABW5E220_9BACT